MNLTDLIKLGNGASIAKLQTTISTGGGNQCWVDSSVVSDGYVRVIQAMSLSSDSKLSASENIFGFVCDQTMSPGINPSPQGGGTDFSKLGVLIGSGSVGTTFSTTIYFVMPLAVMASGMFLRFVTITGTGAAPTAGDFANIQVLYSDIPICDPCG